MEYQEYPKEVLDGDGNRVTVQNDAEEREVTGKPKIGRPAKHKD